MIRVRLFADGGDDDDDYDEDNYDDDDDGDYHDDHDDDYDLDNNYDGDDDQTDLREARMVWMSNSGRRFRASIEGRLDLLQHTVPTRTGSRLTMIRARSSIGKSRVNGCGLVVNIKHRGVCAKQLTGSSDESLYRARRLRNQRFANFGQVVVGRWQNALFPSAHVLVVVSAARNQVVHLDVPVRSEVEENQMASYVVCLSPLRRRKRSSETTATVTRDQVSAKLVGLIVQT